MQEGDSEVSVNDCRNKATVSFGKFTKRLLLHKNVCVTYKGDVSFYMANVQNIRLKKFNPHNITANRVVLFIGKRGTGKSQFVRDILYYHRKVPVGLVMSPTEESNSFYQDMIPDLFIYYDYKAEVIQNVIKRQRKCVKTKVANSNTFILLDDCMYDKKITKDPSIRAIFMNGRHWNILFMMTMQYCMDLTPDLRSNIDYIYVLRENIISNREKIYKNFFGIFPTFAMFNEVMNRCTENFECLVLDNTSRSNKIEDVVYWYKAPLRGKFRMGDKAFWQHHKQNYNSRYDDDDSDDDNIKSKQTAKSKKKDTKQKTKVTKLS